MKNREFSYVLFKNYKGYFYPDKKVSDVIITPPPPSHNKCF